MRRSEHPRRPRIRVDAPTAVSALGLEARLAPLGAVAFCAPEGWHVELPGIGEVDRVERAVRRWQREYAIDRTELVIGSEPRTIRAADPERELAPLGAGYDGPALEHEP
jgi:hypothetical protein